MTKLLFCVASLIIASCASHTHTRSYQDQQINNTTLQNLVRLLTISTQQQETLFVVAPSHYNWASPKSTTKATNAIRNDTAKIIRHASTTTSLQDTTAAKAISTAELTTQSETESTTNRQPATPSGNIAGRVYIIIALLILCTIIVWFLRRNLHV